jgi:hypothetical protein
MGIPALLVPPAILGPPTDLLPLEPALPESFLDPGADHLAAHVGVADQRADHVLRQGITRVELAHVDDVEDDAEPIEGVEDLACFEIESRM